MKDTYSGGICLSKGSNVWFVDSMDDYGRQKKSLSTQQNQVYPKSFVINSYTTYHICTVHLKKFNLLLTPVNNM